ncbi:hypothetical protein HDU96_008282 [Phlyctochytrium bullatum]|nr:hypothetical protein HDU96_008282 [Phlyctochytrium bullatum]
MVGYYVAKPSEYLIIRGAGIADLHICTKYFVIPGQHASRMNMAPVNYTLSLQAMSHEKLEFTLPAVFTIGPKDEPEFLYRYARLLAETADRSPNSLENLIRGVIEGEMRVIAASLTIEEIFKDRKSVKESIMLNVQKELNQFGLFIYNANIKQLHDSTGSEYFQYMRLKTHEGAVNQAKVDVAEARYLGDVGEAERKGKTRQENSRIEANTMVFENERRAEMVDADTRLNLHRTQNELKVNLAKIEAEKAAELRGVELQTNIETKKAGAEEERLRATQLAKAKVEAEATIARADADMYKKQREADAALYAKAKVDAEAQLAAAKVDAEATVAKADAELYKKQREADATLYTKAKIDAEAAVATADAELYRRQKTADAEWYAKQKEADAALYASQKEAEAIKARFEAQAHGLKAIKEAVGDPNIMLQYIMIEKGFYQDLARANAEAVRGLQPKLNIWNTGSGSGDASGDPLKAVRDMQSLVPLISGVNEMTGIAPPAWIGTMPNAGPVAEPRVNGVVGKAHGAAPAARG